MAGIITAKDWPSFIADMRERWLGDWLKGAMEDAGKDGKSPEEGSQEEGDEHQEN